MNHDNAAVMAGLDPAIHLFCPHTVKMDARIKSAHDGCRRCGGEA